MGEVARDQLWKSSFDLLYDSFVAERTAELQVARLSGVDFFSRLLVALTASGSAVSGWALWSRPPARLIWTALAGFAAVLSVVHLTASIADKTKNWEEVKQYFFRLRLDLITFREKMLYDPAFPFSEFKDEHFAYRERYAEGRAIVKTDILLFDGLRRRAQKSVNKSLSGMIVE